MTLQQNSIISFSNDQIGEIRGFIDDKGNPWFLAGKVCGCLKLKNSSKALGDLKEKHLRYGDKIEGVTIRYPLLETRGGYQKVAVINESLLYELIFQSRTEKAFQFQQWVFTKVLPELRKHSLYRMEGKLIRRSLTDRVQSSGEQERMHGHAYSNYTIMIYKSLGLPNKVDRDKDFTPEGLEQIAIRENLVNCMISEGKSYTDIKNYLSTLPKINNAYITNNNLQLCV